MEEKDIHKEESCYEAENQEAQQLAELLESFEGAEKLGNEAYQVALEDQKKGKK